MSYESSADQATSVNVSSNTLFHFTNSLDNLINILRRDFRPHWCSETLTWGKQSMTFVVPMVSFCDLPLFLIKKHLERYGDYGIGLAKQWGMSRGISPVLYIHSDSPSHTLWNEILRKTAQQEVENVMNELGDAIIKYNRYLKQYEGEDHRNKKNGTRTFRFYDEREWRYVPDMERGDLIYNAHIFEVPAELKEVNDKLWNKCKLEFTPNDIRFIIVKTENEVFDMKQKLQEIKMKFNPREVEILTTRIISSERIIQDI